MMTNPHPPSTSENNDEPSSPADRKTLPKGRTGKKDKRNRFTPQPTGTVELHDNDRLILELLDEHRIVTSRQLLLVAGGAYQTERSFRNRLARLFHDEYIARPRRRKGTGAYTLGIHGHQALYPELWTGPTARPPKDWRQKDRRIGIQAIEHEATLTEVLLAFRIAAEQRGWAFDWCAEEAFHQATGFPDRLEVPLDNSRTIHIPLHPDAFITIAVGEHRYHWFLEIDMGSEPVQRSDWNQTDVAKKLVGYWHLRNTMLRSYDRRRDSFQVLFVTRSRARIESLRLRGRDVDPKKLGTHFFLFSTHDGCMLDEADTIFERPLWWTAKQGYDNPRPFFLQTCPTCNQSVDPSNEAHVVLNALPEPFICAPAATLLPDQLPVGVDPEYAHHGCPGLRPNHRT